MSTGGVPRDGPPQGQVPFIRKNAQLLKELPEPGEQWMSDRIPGELADQLVGLRNRGIVQRIGRDEHDDWKKLRCIWETDSGAYERIQEVLEGNEDAPLPCGHSAINNERGVDGITCGVCDAVHEYSEVSL